MFRAILDLPTFGNLLEGARFHYLTLGPAPCFGQPCPCYTIRGPWSLQGPSQCLKLSRLGCVSEGMLYLQKARQLCLHQLFELFAIQGYIATLFVSITVKHHDQSLHCFLQIRRHCEMIKAEGHLKMKECTKCPVRELVKKQGRNL